MDQAGTGTQSFLKKAGNRVVTFLQRTQTNANANKAAKMDDTSSLESGENNKVSIRIGGSLLDAAATLYPGVVFVPCEDHPSRQFRLFRVRVCRVRVCMAFKSAGLGLSAGLEPLHGVGSGLQDWSPCRIGSAGRL